MSTSTNTNAPKNHPPAKLITDHIDVWASAIKRKNTQGRGSSKKIELYGIKKLRELILELAVRGLLVPQNPNDEPASELLKKIAAEKEQLIKDKKIKKQKTLPPISEEEKPFDLPAGWEWTQLGHISEIAPRNSLDDNLEVSFVPMPMISTSYKGDHEQEVKVWGDIKKGYTHFANGDIALAKITPCFENSKAAILTNLKNGFGAGTTELHIARPIPHTISALFVLLYLKAPMFLEKGKPKMTGSAGQKRIPSDFFSGNPFPFPPIKEQHRIVAKVDELMTLCDQLEQQTEASLTAHNTLVDTLLGALTNATDHTRFQQAWERIAEHFDSLFTTEKSIDQLKQTLLQLAVMGKLVSQASAEEKKSPDYEPVSELLKRIATEKEQLIKEKKIKKQKPLPPISDEEKTFELPTGWEWCRVWDIAELITSGSRDWAKYYSDEGAIFVTMGNLSRGSYEMRLDNLRYVQPPEKGEGNRTRLEEKDLLISITGDVGNLGLIPKNFGESYINQHTALLRFMPDCKDRFFPEVMRSPLAKFQFNAPQRGIKNSFRLGDVGEMVIPLPPKNERERIVEKINNLITLCDQLKTRLNTAQTTQLQLADTLAEQAVGQR